MEIKQFGTDEGIESAGDTKWNWSATADYASQIGVMTKLCTFSAAESDKVDLLICDAQVLRSSWSLYKILQNQWGNLSLVRLMIQKTFLKTFRSIIVHSRLSLFVLRLFMREDLSLHLMLNGKCIGFLLPLPNEET